MPRAVSYFTSWFRLRDTCIHNDNVRAIFIIKKEGIREEQWGVAGFLFYYSGGLQREAEYASTYHHQKGVDIRRSRGG